MLKLNKNVFFCFRFHLHCFLFFFFLNVANSSISLSLSVQFNQTGRGSECSQAIMLVTDGAVDTYDTIFAKYNWPDRKVVCQTHTHIL